MAIHVVLAREQLPADGTCALWSLMRLALLMPEQFALKEEASVALRTIAGEWTGMRWRVISLVMIELCRSAERSAATFVGAPIFAID